MWYIHEINSIFDIVYGQHSFSNYIQQLSLSIVSFTVRGLYCFLLFISLTSASYFTAHFYTVVSELYSFTDNANPTFITAAAASFVTVDQYHKEWWNKQWAVRWRAADDKLHSLSKVINFQVSGCVGNYSRHVQHEIRLWSLLARWQLLTDFFIETWVCLAAL